MTGKRNKRAGSDYERSLRLDYQEMGWKNCETSRYANRSLDDKGVDLCFTNPFNVQAKYQKNTPNIEKVLDSMPDDTNYNIIHWKKNVGKGKGKKEYVIMAKEDWYDILLSAIREGIIKTV